MFCIRDEEKWYCVQDKDYLKWTEQHKEALVDDKTRYIVNNGVEYNKAPKTGKFKEKVQ